MLRRFVVPRLMQPIAHASFRPPLKQNSPLLPVISSFRRAFATTPTAGGETNQLILTLSSPSECAYKSTPVGSVTLPGVEGEFTVTPNHAPLVTFLRNGVVTVNPLNNQPERKFFISDGFFLLQGPSDDSGNCFAEVLGIEMVPTEFLDKEKTVQVLQDLLQNAAASTDEWEKMKSLLGQELCSAILNAAP